MINCFTIVATSRRSCWHPGIDLFHGGKSSRYFLRGLGPFYGDPKLIPDERSTDMKFIDAAFEGCNGPWVGKTSQGSILFAASINAEKYLKGERGSKQILVFVIVPSLEDEVRLLGGSGRVHGYWICEQTRAQYSLLCLENGAGVICVGDRFIEFDTDRMSFVSY